MDRTDSALAIPNRTTNPFHLRRYELDVQVLLKCVIPKTARTLQRGEGSRVHRIRRAPMILPRKVALRSAEA